MSRTMDEIEADFYAKVDRGEIILSPEGDAKRARDERYRRLAYADADTLIDDLGIKDMRGPWWDALRADICIAAAITKDGPERAIAWGRLYAPALDPSEPSTKSLDPDDLFYNITKRRLFSLYFRWKAAPTGDGLWLAR